MASTCGAQTPVETRDLKTAGLKIQPGPDRHLERSQTLQQICGMLPIHTPPYVRKSNIIVVISLKSYFYLKKRAKYLPQAFPLLFHFVVLSLLVP